MDGLLTSFEVLKIPYQLANIQTNRPVDFRVMFDYKASEIGALLGLAGLATII